MPPYAGANSDVSGVGASVFLIAPVSHEGDAGERFCEITQRDIGGKIQVKVPRLSRTANVLSMRL